MPEVPEMAKTLKPTYIVLHCSETKDSGTVSWGAIRRYHTSVLGWDDIGYHFGVERVGEDFEVLLGRLPNIHGAHCKAAGMNGKSLGICCVGSFSGESVPEQQWLLALRLARYLMAAYMIPADKVIGHREVEAAKTCPGAWFNMDKFRGEL
jgi:N-acetylmuramoyl-L-alanine amidase